MSLDLVEAIAQLGDARSPRRRSAAKHLRRLADPAAGPALVEAVRSETKDVRTWETQYQMIMAIGAARYRPALEFLYELAGRRFAATMVYVAIGDAIVRIGREYDNDPTPCLWCLDADNDSLADGALRAVAMLRLRLDDKAIQRILRFLSKRSPYDGLRFWPAVAAAGWSGSAVTTFLKRCARGPSEDVAEAARASLTGTYKQYRPL